MYSTRLKLEAKLFNEDPYSGCTLVKVSDDMKTWYINIEGPKGSPYDNHIFLVKVELNSLYPAIPPNI